MRVSQRVLAWVLVVGVMGLGAALRWTGAAAKWTLEHDESWSYLQAAGNFTEAHRIAFEKVPPYGTWVPAREWKRLLQPNRPLDFGQISHDLAHSDIHPPLYFWLLHIAGLIVGVHLWTGPMLNTVLDLIGGLVLFQFAKQVTGRPLLSAMVVGLWLLSPSVLLCAITEARQYSLLGLTSILFCQQAYLAARVDHPLRWQRWVGLTLTTLAGLLAHYHFPIVIVGASLYLAVALFRRDRRRLLRAAAAVALGGALFVAIHPQFVRSIQRQQGFQRNDWAKLYPHDIGPFIRTVAIPRLDRSQDALMAFVAFDPVARKAAILFVLGTLSASAWILVRRRRRRVRHDARSTSDVAAEARDPYTRDAAIGVGDGAAFVVFMAIWTAGVVIALYAAGQSGWHAMGFRYLAPTWPLLAMLPALLARVDRLLAALLLLALITLATTTSIGAVRELGARPNAAGVMARATRLIVDNPDFGRWPPAVWNVPDDVPVLIAWADDLAREPETFAGLLEPGTLYVSVPDDRIRPETRQELLRQMRAHRPFDMLGTGPGLAVMYRAR